MKKIIAVLVMLLMLSLFFVACGDESDESNDSSVSFTVMGNSVVTNDTDYSFTKGFDGQINWFEVSTNYADEVTKLDGSLFNAYITEIKKLLIYSFSDAVDIATITNTISPVLPSSVILIVDMDANYADTNGNITNLAASLDYMIMCNFTDNNRTNLKIVSDNVKFTKGTAAVGDYYEGTFNLVVSNKGTDDVFVVTNGYFKAKRSPDDIIHGT